MLLEGDILNAEGAQLSKEGQLAAAEEKYASAAAKYMVPAQFFEDSEITPESIDKTALALDNAGQKAQASDFRRLLKNKYPGYKRPLKNNR
jgi:TolA-binding protein